jgi:putative GTP pyrophosphokinase
LNAGKGEGTAPHHQRLVLAIAVTAQFGWLLSAYFSDAGSRSLTVCGHYWSDPVSLKSRKTIDNLGDRFRKLTEEPGDRDLLHLYQRIRCQGIPELFEQVAAPLGGKYSISCRIKRVDTMIRKLRRNQNHGMDLSRMDDVVGFRIITPAPADQAVLITRLTSTLAGVEIRHDYLKQPQATGYRAVHLLVKQPVTLVEATVPTLFPCEIQVRTYYQHLWASQSEGRGEQVKEGGGTDADRDYLAALAERIRSLEESAPDRAQISIPAASDGVSFVVVQFDKQRGEIINKEEFGRNIEAALDFSQYLDDSTRADYGFETVLLGVQDERRDLRITHIRYFRLGGLPDMPDELHMGEGPPPESAADPQN